MLFLLTAASEDFALAHVQVHVYVETSKANKFFGTALRGLQTYCTVQWSTVEYSTFS